MLRESAQCLNVKHNVGFFGDGRYLKGEFAMRFFKRSCKTTEADCSSHLLPVHSQCSVIQLKVHVKDAEQDPFSVKVGIRELQTRTVII